jgi:molybdopterin-containing oxidoreductase family membrane subunit
MAMKIEHQRRDHLLLDPLPPAQMSQIVLDPMYRTGRLFWISFMLLGGLVVCFGLMWMYQMWWGLGITGLNRPVMWALYIVDFIFFIGIGHAGTFISAALRALKIEWRRPISRAAEIVTVFALITAALFPVIHLGRSWKAYWLFPIPNQRLLWPSFHSPLVWDLMAITTYLTCSIIFVYLSLLPDIVLARDHSKGWRLRLYTALALGWRGAEKEWHNLESAMNIFTYAIIPVMFSVHTVVSWDFAMALQPGWHSTIFGPYFVVGALFSGVGAVLIALILLRKYLHLEYFLRAEHFNGMGMFLLLLSMVWTYFYFNDYLVPWFGNDPVEKALALMNSHGWAAPLWYMMLFSNIIVPCATLWSRRVRTSPPALLVIAIFVQVGMYIERFLIVPGTLSHNEIPASWGIYHPQIPESYISVGAFALVIFSYIIFTRIFPMVPLWEVREGQALHGMRQIGKAVVQTKAEPE